MKVLFEKDNIEFDEVNSVFEKFITNDYIRVDFEDIENNWQRALYSNQLCIIEVKTKYYDDTDLYYLKILSIQLKLNNISAFFNIDTVSVEKNTCENIRYTLTYNQVTNLINSLIIYKDFLSKKESNNIIEETRIKFAIKKTEKDIEYLQAVIKYDYEKACELCKTNSKRNSIKSFGLGESGLEQSAKSI